MQAIRSLALALSLTLGLVGPALAEAPEAPAAQSPAAAKPTFFTLSKFRAENVVMTVWLNGVQLVKTENKGPITSGSMSSNNGWVMPGQNTLVVKLEKMTWPKANHKEEQASVLFEAVAEGGWPGDGQALVDFSTGEQGTTLKLPITKTFTFDVACPPPSTLWTKAEPLTVDAALTDEARAIAQQIVTGFAHKDAATLNRLMAFKVEDDLRADHRGQAEIEAAMKEGFPADVPPLEPVNLSQLRLVPVAGGKVVHLVGPKGEEPLHSKMTADGRVVLDVYLARIDGKLTVVR
jgi:hypothetical protein